MLRLPDIPPSYGTAQATELRVLEANFGDGYRQVAADGLNSVRARWSVVWENYPQDDVFILAKFLKERRGFESFLWTAPGDEEEKRWLCKTLEGPTPAGFESYSLQASFEEVFTL